MLFTVLLLTTALSFGSPGQGDDDKGKGQVLTAHPTNTALNIDGRLDEDDWQNAAVATDFKQYEPDEGAAPTYPTEVRVLYGNNALYVGAHLFDDAPDKIMQTLGRRDERNQADWFFVSIDSYLDRKTAYTFALNAAGVQLDGLTQRDLDTSWDAVWSAAARVTADGWIVEMRIPYAMLRFAEADVQTWGINFRRIVPRLSETSEWALVPRTVRESAFVANFGQLVGLEDLRPRRNLQFTPYTVSQFTSEEGEPGEGLRSTTADFGGDLKLGISSNITLDATFNPDFGQVDADPAQLNLSAFETFFEERRPFFVEGVQIFDFSYGRDGGLLYTRRIGGANPIIGATKLSGRTEGGLSFGFFGAATGDNFNPSRLYSVARVQQEIGRHSSIGGMVTGYDRTDEVDVDDIRSLTGGLDWDLRFQDNRYRADGHVSFSRRAFRSTPDPTETGLAFSAAFDKIRGVWTYETSFTLFDDVFNTNDLGRLRRNNTMQARASFEHLLNGGDPFGPFRRASLRMSGWQNWAYDSRINTGAGFFLFSNWQTRGFQSFRLVGFTDYLFGGYDQFETRGLSPRRQPRQVNLRGSFETDSRRNWQLEPGGRVEYWADGGTSTEIQLEASWNAGPRVSLAGEVSVGREDNVIAWASNESFARLGGGWGIGSSSGAPEDLDGFVPLADGGALDGLLADVTPYDASGAYYLPLFGARDTRRFDASLRSTITFTPNLSLQLYGQFFAARGQYEDFQILQNQDDLAAFDAYPKRHDFAVHSFQSNLVLRWEYRPSSTIFLVWSQSRQGDNELDPFDLESRSPFSDGTSSQFADTFDLFPTNVFLIKLSYKFLR